VQQRPTGVPPHAPPPTSAGLVLYPETCEYSFSITIAQNVRAQYSVDGDAYDEHAHGVLQRRPPARTALTELAGTAVLPGQTASYQGSGPCFTTQDLAVVVRRQATPSAAAQTPATIGWTLLPDTDE
jgi:hypothetical protein